MDGALRIGETERTAELFLGYWVGKGALAAMPAERRASVVAAMQKLEYEWPFSLRRVHASIAELGALDMPTLLVHGARSPFAMQRLMAILRNALPRAESVVIEGAGHMAPVTHAEWVNAPIAAHLAPRSAARDVPALRLANAPA